MKSTVKIFFPQTLVILLVGGLGYFLFHPEVWYTSKKEPVEPPASQENPLASNTEKYLKIDPAHRVPPVYVGSIDSRPRTPSALGYNKSKLYIAYHGLNMIDVLDSAGRRQSFFDAYPQGPLHIGGLSFDEGGNLYVVDLRSQKILAYDSELQFKGFFTAANLGANNEVQMPINMNMHRGLAFVVDFKNSAVKSYLANGEYVLSIIHTGKEEGKSWHPISSLQTQDGRVLVADILNKQIAVFTCAGKFAYYFAEAEGGDNLSAPGTMDMDGMGRVHVIDSKLNKIFVYDSYGRFLFTYGLKNKKGGLVPTDGISIAHDEKFIFLADNANQQIEIWKY